MPNYYNDGDGLNMAALRWTRTTKGEDTVYGSGMDSARQSITVKMDHNLNAEHRLSGTYSYERSFSTGEHEPTWPDGFGGAIDRKPQTFTSALTSTLRPTLLNEFRFGLAYNNNRTITPIDQPDTGDQLKQLMQEFVPTGSWSTWQGLPVLVAPGSGDPTIAVNYGFRFNPNESHYYGGRLPAPATWGSNDYRWTFADTLTGRKAPILLNSEPTSA
jgi:hypothetical protein